MSSILDKIAETKRHEIMLAKKQRPLNQLQEQEPLPLRDFVRALRSKQPAIIAEIKKASPSKGIIRADFDVASIAAIYESHGASCISVLTDVTFFQGDPSYLAIAKQHCSRPILRKDFILDPYQIHESRALGADCILLIVALLDDAQLHDYCQLAQELGMSVLVESHTAEEVARAIRLPTPLMGINNRCLHHFDVSIQRSVELKSLIPDDKIIISESGIHHQNDVQYLEQHGIHTFLIGEHFMGSDNIGKALSALLPAS